MHVREKSYPSGRGGSPDDKALIPLIGFNSTEPWWRITESGTLQKGAALTLLAGGVATAAIRTEAKQCRFGDDGLAWLAEHPGLTEHEAVAILNRRYEHHGQHRVKAVFGILGQEVINIPKIFEMVSVEATKIGAENLPGCYLSEFFKGQAAKIPEWPTCFVEKIGKMVLNESAKHTFYHGRSKEHIVDELLGLEAACVEVLRPVMEKDAREDLLSADKDRRVWAIQYIQKLKNSKPEFLESGSASNQEIKI